MKLVPFADEQDPETDPNRLGFLVHKDSSSFVTPGPVSPYSKSSTQASKPNITMVPFEKDRSLTNFLSSSQNATQVTNPLSQPSVKSSTPTIAPKGTMGGLGLIGETLNVPNKLLGAGLVNDKPKPGQSFIDWYRNTPTAQDVVNKELANAPIFKDAPLLRMPVGLIVGAAIDPTNYIPLGGEAKVFKSIALSVDSKLIGNTLRELRIPEKYIGQMAKDLVMVTKPAEVKTYIKEAKGLILDDLRGETYKAMKKFKFPKIADAMHPMYQEDMGTFGTVLKKFEEENRNIKVNEEDLKNVQGIMAHYSPENMRAMGIEAQAEKRAAEVKAMGQQVTPQSNILNLRSGPNPNPKLRDPKGMFRAALDEAKSNPKGGFIKNPLATKEAVTDVSKMNPDEYVKYLTGKQETARAGEKPGIVQKFKGFLGDIKAKLVDSNAPIEDALRTAQKEHKFSLLPSDDISNQIDRVLRSPTIAGQFVKDTGFDKVIRNVDNLEAFDQYLIARHAQDLAKNGIKTGRNLEKDAELLKAFASKYEEPAKQVTAYSRKLLDYATDSGLISKELAIKLKEIYPNYVPMNRVFSELEKTGGEFGSKAVASLSKQSIVQKLVGSEREVESPIASLLGKTGDAFAQGERNKAGKLLASYEKLPGNPLQLKEITGETISNRHTITFLDNGVKRTFETTQEIAEAAKRLNFQQLNVLGKIFALPVRIARIGITGINLPFLGANLAKDQLTAFVNSEKALRTSVLNPPVFLKSLWESIGHGELYQEMVRMGGAGTSYDLARNQVAPTIDKIRAGKSLISKAFYTVRHPSELLRAVENIVSRGEEFTRIKQYKGTKDAMLKMGFSEYEASVAGAKAARNDTVNFARKGDWGTVLNSAFLYLNANIQGTRSFLRAVKTHPIASAAKLATAGFMPMATITLWNLSDPERKAAYDDIPAYEKENNFLIIPPHPEKNAEGKWNVIKIPISQELNNMLNLIRRPIEQLMGEDPVKASEIFQAVAGTVLPVKPDKGSLLSTFTPQAIKPTVEGATNTNLFTGYPQVPDSLKQLSPENQVKDKTSGTTRVIGKTLGVSPIKTEEFIKGTFGGVGSQVLNASDRVLAGLDVIPKNQIGGQDVLNAVMARFNQAAGGATNNKTDNQLKDVLQKQADDHFRVKQEAELLFEELKKMKPEEANTKAQAIKSTNPELYAKLKKVFNDDKLGLTYSDRLIGDLDVTNGARAQFIYEQLQAKKTPQEKQDLYNEYKRKKLISPEVNKQLKKLLNP